MTNDAHVCYALEGNVVDRVSTKNGKGWCEDVSPTLNTQDRHAVVYALEGNGARPSHMGKGFSSDGTMYTLNTIEQHSVCYAIENHPNDSRVTVDPDGIVQTLSSRMGTGGNNTPFVLIRRECYAVDSHPGDSRINIQGDICPTITYKIAKASSDGPLVLIKENT